MIDHTESSTPEKQHTGREDQTYCWIILRRWMALRKKLSWWQPSRFSESMQAWMIMQKAYVFNRNLCANIHSTNLSLQIWDATIAATSNLLIEGLEWSCRWAFLEKMRWPLASTLQALVNTGKLASNLNNGIKWPLSLNSTHHFPSTGLNETHILQSWPLVPLCSSHKNHLWI